VTVRLKKDSLKQGHRKAIGLDNDEDVALSAKKSSGTKKLSTTAEALKPPTDGKYARTMERFFTHDRVELLHDIPPHIVKKAWFTMSHALLNPGSVVLDSGCSSGEMTYAMSVLYPQFEFIGIDNNPEMVKQASYKFQRPNLKFQQSNIYVDLKENSYDLIINSFFLHEVYSASFFNDRMVQMALEKQYKALRDRGSLIIRDYLNPPPGEYVLLEFTDKGTSGDTFETMSEAELLIWFADHARAKSNEGDMSGDSGFFLEELPPNYPRTRLFRIPAKWAYEFIIRKDDRHKMRQELAKEYAFMTESEFRKQLRGLGARVSYSAPHWDEGFIKTRYTGAMRLYKEDGTKMGPPPTNYIMVARKIAEHTSQMVMERRTSRARAGSVYIRSVRDEKSGAITDIVCRDVEIAEVLPFRVTPDNKLKVYLHEDVPRGLTNSVPRCGLNLDGRRWSGHMIEAIGTPALDMGELKEADNAKLKSYMSQHIGLTPSLDAQLMEGGGFYPDPNQIDERIVTYYFRVENYHEPFSAQDSLKDIEGFSSKGFIREFDAQEILNAVAVGFIPTSRLELQILGLFQMLGIKSEVWSDSPLQLSEVPIEDTVKINDILKQYALKDDRFKPVRGSAGTVRLVQSVFVDEGRDQGGGMAGLAARDLEFAVPENGTLNTAVVLPLVKNLNGEVMAGVVTQYMPVPQRYNGTGQILTLPSFPLPKDVTDIEAAKFYIAEQFQVKPEHVARMGESYFTHIGLTPHRIYPFAVTDMRGFYNGQTHGTTQLTMLKDLWKILYWDNHDSFLKVAAIACQHLLDSDLSLKHDFDFKIAPAAQQSTVLTSSVLDYGSGSSSPSSSSKTTNSEETVSSSQAASPLDAFRSPRVPL
jgi:ubiquinone/menaquinone biosynthesis C-methylase UbiE